MSERIEIFILTVFLALASLLVSHHQWRLRWLYFSISVLFGFFMGFMANRTPFLEEWDYVIAATSTLLGPAILIWLRGKTLNEVIDDLADIKGKLKDNATSLQSTQDQVGTRSREEPQESRGSSPHNEESG